MSVRDDPESEALFWLYSHNFNQYRLRFVTVHKCFSRKWRLLSEETGFAIAIRHAKRTIPDTAIWSDDPNGLSAGHATASCASSIYQCAGYRRWTSNDAVSVVSLNDNDKSHS